MSSRGRQPIKKMWPIALLLIADGFFFSLVNPTNGNSFVVIGGCVLLALTLYLILAMLISLVALFVPISERSRKRFALTVTITLVFLLLMQSVGQLSWRDVLAVVPLMAVLYLYLTYIAKPKADQS